MSEVNKYQETQNKFELACRKAENLSIMQNAGAAFQAVVVVKSLRELLTDEIMKEVFMPLMNTKIGFLTDRPMVKDGKVIKPAYEISTVRDAIIDAASFGLLPTFNQFNIIADKMYPTKEGFTALLKKLKVIYVLNFGPDTSAENAKFAEIVVKVTYQVDGEDKKPFLFNAVVPKTSYSSYDQLKGKAERRAKKMLYEFVTGHDLGDNDGDSVGASQDSSSRNIKDAEIISQNEPVANDQTIDQPEPVETIKI